MSAGNEEQGVANERTPILSGEESPCSSGFLPKRYVLALLGCFGFINVYAMRVNLSMALVAMKRHVVKLHTDDYSVVCSELVHYRQYNNTVTSTEEAFIEIRGEFDWNSNQEAIILGSFFMGYVVTQIPAGALARRFGAKRLFGIGVLITAIFTLLTPVAARWSFEALIFCRVMEGLGEGVTFPAMNALIGTWVPKMERSRIATIIYIGSPIGTVVAMMVSGVLSDSDFLGGWPSVFYVFGVLGVIWFAFWMYYVYESPKDHPTISKEELRLIEADQDNIWRNVSIPWWAILTSVPLWALVVAHFGQNWGFYTLLTELPTYMSEVLHFNLKKNGILSAFPYLSQAVCSLLSSFLADSLRKKGYNITFIRKLMNSIAFFGSAFCILLVIFVECRPVIILILLITALGLNGFINSGFNVTHVDMSPQYAGILMGITNCIANTSGFLAPLFVGKVTETGHSLENWSIVFITTSCMFCVTAIIFILFGSAELQPWGRSSSDSRRNSNRSDSRNIPPQVILHRSSQF